MKKIITIILGLLVYSMTSFSQTHELADSLWNAAKQAVEVEDYQKAAELFEKSALAEKQCESPRLEDLVVELGEASYYYWEVDNKEKAILLREEAVGVCEKSKGKAHQDCLFNKDWCAFMYKEIGHYDRALSLYVELLEGTEKSHADYGTRSNNLANLYYSRKEYDKALPWYQETIENAELNLGKDHVEYGTRLHNLANLYYYGKNDVHMALPLYEKVLKIAANTLGEQHPDYGNLLEELSFKYLGVLQYEDAVEYGLEALQNADINFGKDHIEYGRRLFNVLQLYCNLRQYDKIVPFFAEVIHNFDSNLKDDPTEYSFMMTGVALLYETARQYDKAIILYEKALKTIEKKYGKTHPDYEAYFNEIALLYKKNEQYDVALDLYLEILERIEEEAGAIHPQYISILMNVAYLHYKTNQFIDALQLYKKALNIIKNTVGEENDEYEMCLNTIAFLYKKLERYDEALPLYLESLEITEKKDWNYHIYGISCLDLATLYQEMKQYDRALPLYFKSLENLTKQMQNQFIYLAEEHKQNLLDNIGYQLDIIKSFFYSHNYQQTLSVYYDTELLMKGIIAVSVEDVNKTISQSEDIKVIDLRQQWNEKKAQIAKQYTMNSVDRSIFFNKLIDEARELEQQLVKLSISSNEAPEIAKTTWKDIQSGLENNEVAIEFSSFQYRNDKQWTDTIHYTALVLRKNDEQPQLIPLFTQAALDSALTVSGSDKSAINRIYRGGRARSEQQDFVKIYDLVWKPLDEYLNEGETIYFAPSGTLHQIAFSAIVDSEGKFLSDKYDLRQVSTTAKILQQEDQTKLDDVVLFGGIDYEADEDDLATVATMVSDRDGVVSRSLTSDLDRGGESWNYLKGTLDEVVGIKSLAENAKAQVRYYTGVSAFEEGFKSLHGKASPHILHIATHGFFFPDPEKEARDEHFFLSEEEINVFKLSDNPLNRSGLLFAGGNRAWRGEEVAADLEDGILTAYEASHVSLPNTHLVVLSACETGLGDIKGSEGVFGLQRAFKMAGADYLLMSLWKVPDRETAEFMETFYTHLFENQDIEQSYKTTLHYMKSKYKDDPYSWAAFVLVR